MGEEIVSVTGLGPGRWRVEVRGASRTVHDVTIPDGYLEQLGVAAKPERVLEESFLFLLEREPNTSILPAFALPVIASYFPEYERELPRRLG